MKLPEPIIFTKEMRKGIILVAQFFLEFFLVVGVFVAGLFSVIKTIGLSWIFPYTLLFVAIFFLCVIAGHYPG